MRTQKAAIGQQTQKGQHAVFGQIQTAKKENDDPMIDCGALYVVSSIDDARSEKRVVRNTKIN